MADASRVPRPDEPTPLPPLPPALQAAARARAVEGLPDLVALVDAEVGGVLTRLEALCAQRLACVARLEAGGPDRDEAARELRTAAAAVTAALDDLARLIDLQAAIAAHRAALDQASRQQTGNDATT